MRISGLPRSNGKKINQKYGVIKTSFLHYITPTMFLVVVMCLGLVYMNFEQVSTNFQTNIPLNSLIFLVFSIAMVEAFKNNLNVFHVALFFKRMEGQVNAPIVDPAQMEKLKSRLETSAYLVNTQNTFELVDNLQKFGHPLVTDNDARIIKSKLGYRIRSQRGRVSFMAGLLVMLGLIGTFWGLLLTIGAVGDAMHTIADQADTLGAESEGGIGNIIESISAPLQGMGLAFSSSLFGLSGSLVVGFFNYACTQAQDKAIEDFSRWIDNNIPAVGTEEDKVRKLSQPEAESRPKESSLQTAEVKGQSANQNSALDDNTLSQIVYVLKETSQAHSRLSNDFEALLSSQKAIHDVLVAESVDVKAIKETGGELNKLLEAQSGEIKGIKSACMDLNKWLEAQSGDIAAVRQVSSSTEQVLEEIRNVAYRSEETFKAVSCKASETVDTGKKIHDQLVYDNGCLEKAFDHVRNDLSRMTTSIETSNQHFAKIKESMEGAQANDSRLIKEVSYIKDRIPRSEYEMIRLACAAIADSIHRMDTSLQENARVMREVAKEGNMEKMARILKEMQNFWLQMRLGSVGWKERQKKRGGIKGEQ